MNFGSRGFGFGLVSAASLLVFAGLASGQVTPDRLYYGIGRAVPMKVAIPAGTEGKATLQLLEPVTSALVEQADVAAGAVNVAEKFPTLWTTSAPRLMYLQLVVGDKPIGAPVVMQPMLTPDYCTSIDRAQNPVWQRMENRIYSGVRAYTDKHVVLDTTKGEVEIKMRPDVAPNTVWSFRGLVDGGFYTEVIFHRIADLSADSTIDILQVGDPGAGNLATAGQGGPGFYVDLEPSTLKHDLGVISMARSRDGNSNGSQFFLCLNNTGVGFLDGKYTTFGTTVKGTDVLKTLGAVQINANSRPIDPPMIKTAKLVDAPPLTPTAKVEPKPEAKPETPAPAPAPTPSGEKPKDR